MLPILAVLMVMAIDVGRLYFGWIAETNVARAGASYAGLHPDAWDLPYASSTAADRAIQDTYVLRMEQDAQAINCTLPSPLPPPAFEDATGDGTAHQVNDLVRVQLTCAFTLLTPLAGNLLGNPLVIGAEAVFPIRGGRIDAPLITPSPQPSPSPTAQPSATPVPTSTPAPTVAPCRVPQFIGDIKNQTQLKSKWYAAGFVRNNLSVTGGNWSTVGSQSLIGGSSQSCETATIVVGP